MWLILMTYFWRCEASVLTLYIRVDTTLRVNKNISDDNQKNLVFRCNIFCSLYTVSSEVWHSDTWYICFTQKRQPRLHTYSTHGASAFYINKAVSLQVDLCRMAYFCWRNDCYVEGALHASNVPLYNKLWLF